MTDAPAPQGPAPKPGILDIAPYVGGKSRIEGVAEPMKLSSNENMLGAGQKAREAFEAAVRNIHVYPDGRASKLRETVAEHHGLEPERLIFGNGSDEVFALLNQCYLTPGDNIVTGQYGFLAYRISAKANQADVKLAPEPKYKAEVDALLDQVDDRTRIVYVSNPSNPTGSYNTGEEIRRLHEGLRPDVILVVDEQLPDAPTAVGLSAVITSSPGFRSFITASTAPKSSRPIDRVGRRVARRAADPPAADASRAAEPARSCRCAGAAWLDRARPSPRGSAAPGRASLTTSTTAAAAHVDP